MIKSIHFRVGAYHSVPEVASLLSSLAPPFFYFLPLLNFKTAINGKKLLRLP